MATQGKLPTRDEMNSSDQWNLADIYHGDQAWEADFTRAKQIVEEIQQFKGQLTNGEQLLRCLRLQDQGGMLLDKLTAYALMHKDEDNSNSKYQALADRAISLSVQASSATAFIEPELLSLDPNVVRSWIGEVDGLGLYRHYLENIIRTKPHTLPTEQEELLAQAAEIGQAPGDIFRMFNNADLKFPCIKDEQGQEVELTHGRYIQLMESKNRQVRQAAFTAMYSTYSDWKNTLATTYASAVKKTAFFARARKYNSGLEAALDEDNVQPEVYKNLIDTVHQHLPLFYRYMKLRKQLLNLDELHMYDIYVPVVSDFDMKVTTEQAMETIKQGLKPLGQQYLADLSQGFAGGWIDWYENKGKTSGAYSWGAYGVHPFVLMNWQDNLDNMFTLAHEMGHALHSFYSDQHQEFVNSQYTIFVAEVASTLNECLLINYLLNKATDPKEKLYLLNHYIEQFRGTLIRQTMFAEFEMLVHDKIGNGEPMTAESLSEQYYQLNTKYYGPEVNVDQDIAMEWARIPHFYRPFYVYKYATGFSAAVALSQQILTEGQPAVERYLNFLSSGGSDYPIELLKKAGVDMSSPQPIVQAMQVFEQLLTEMEGLAKV